MIMTVKIRMTMTPTAAMTNRTMKSFIRSLPTLIVIMVIQIMMITARQTQVTQFMMPNQIQVKEFNLAI